MKQSRKYTVYFYLITPVVLLAVFIAFFNRFQATQRVEEARKAEAAQVEKAKADAAQAEMEKRLDAEAKLVADAKAKMEADKAAKDKAANEEKFNELRDHMADVQDKLDSLTKTNAEKAAKIKAVRAERLKAEAEWLNLSRELERERAVKSATDLETQRLTGMVMDRFEEEWCKSLTTPPPPPVKK